MTDLKVLHEHGLSHHQTSPLKTAGHDTAEAVAALVDAHRATAAASALAQIPGFGGRRVALVCDAIDSWRAGLQGDLWTATDQRTAAQNGRTRWL